MARRHDTTDRCGVCRRTILTGERPARFRDERQRALQLVCTLCVERAERLGWVPDAVGEDGAPAPRRMIADAAVDPEGEGWRRFRVQCDLVARLFDVIDVGHGALESPGRAFRPNARLVDGRVELLAEREQVTRS